MSPKFEQFVRAVIDYPEFKAQFRKFCETSAVLNNNSKLPGVSFSADRDGTIATIRLLDQAFVVRFHIVARGDSKIGTDARLGLLEIYLPTSRDEEILLWRTFFDIHGMVRGTPDAPPTHSHLGDKDFIEKLLGEFTDRYFLRLTETLKLGAQPLPSA